MVLTKKQSIIMKSSIIAVFISAVLLLCQFSANATVYRVNNTGADADFTEAQAAHDGVNAGDTLYFESSPTTYGALSITKEIHVIGNGYFLGENQDLQAQIAPATLNNVTFQSGSDNSTIQGMTITTVLCGSNATFDDIVIERNHITFGIYFSSSQDLNNIYILRNYIYGSNSTYNTFRTNGTGTNSFVVSNNIFVYINSFSRITMDANTTATFKNNIINVYNISSTFCVYKNNIINSASGIPINESTNTVSYNTCVSSYCSSNNNNTNNAVFSALFVGLPNNTSDSQYMLSGSSDAAGAGEAGIDCGVYDGEVIYKLSGIPAIPSIYKLIAPSIVSGNFNITISTRSNN